MAPSFHLIAVVLLCGLRVPPGNGYMVGNNPYHRIEILDSQNKYHLEWKVDRSLQQVIFNVTVETKGYVGFGLSSKGKMTGADVVIGGVTPTGKPYFSDRHAVANQMPEVDPSQDWKLHVASENETHTFLSFSRAFDTCDPQDYPITEDKISLIWAYGERDTETGYHYRNRGEFPVYLIHPDYTPPSFNTSPQAPDKDLQVWTVHTRLEIPARDTTYWCTLHQAPQLPQKHHVVGFHVRFPNPQSLRHVHHLSFLRCRAPEGRTTLQMFGSYVHHPGQLCYSFKSPSGPIPTEYCTEYFQAWGVGGRQFFYPPHVGLPLGEVPEEFYLLQIHYDNPEKLSRVQVDIYLDSYYTSDLRPNEGGVMVYRHESPGVTPSILIPPSTVDHSVYGLCGSACTSEILPREGIHIFGLNLHTHNTGAAVKFQHFRGNLELPWIQSDDNYAFDFQQMRILPEEVKVLPGDLLALQCTYDNTLQNGTVVGGYSSQQEMCAVFFYYYSRVLNYIQCSSEIESAEGRERFLGVGNVTWSSGPDPPEFIVQEPPELAGLTATQVADNYVNWDAQKREDLKRFHLTAPHVSRCPRELYSLPASEGYRPLSSGRAENEEDRRRRYVRFPREARPYRPQQSCSFA